MDMKRIASALFAASVCLGILAVPARPVKKTLTLADGSHVEAQFRGDEYAHYYTDGIGRAYVTDSLGISHEVMLADIQARRSARLAQRNSLRMARKVGRKSRWGAEENPISGSRKGIVILASYSDKSMVYTNEDYQGFFNEVGFNRFGMHGSVHDYFLDSSYGLFDLTFDVVGPVVLSKSIKYYGANDSNGDDKYAAEMVAEAVRLADPYVDFADYDWDDDGYVDQVFVIYAGYGESQSDISYTIWPHEYQLSYAKYDGDGPGALTLDGVKVDTYACSCELSGYRGTNIDGIGTACHEFSHCLSIPDMYDTTGYNFGMDFWDLMDLGCYLGPNYDSTCPSPYTSYERMYCGWLKPIELTDPVTIADMPPLSSEPVAYMVRNSGKPSEYYLLENRQNEGWWTYSPGHGLLVIHVDFDASAWTNNTVNNVSTHQRMTIIPADGKLSTNNLSGDTWPGPNGNDELTDTSSPAAKLYNKNANGTYFMGHPITQISESADGLISFLFDGGAFVGVPEGLAAEGITPQGFTATWNAVAGADSYEVEVRESSDPAPSDAVTEEADSSDDAAAYSDPIPTPVLVVYQTEGTRLYIPVSTSSRNCVFRVRAMVGDIAGEWSAGCNVSLGDDVRGVLADQPSSTEPAYDLSGRPASQGKGIFISRGRKYVSNP